MKDKGILTSIILLIVFVLLGVLGFSYAYFQPLLSSTGNQNLVVSKDLRLTFDDESISEGEIYPGDTFSKKFTVTNSGTNTLYYEIDWEDYSNTFLNDEIHIELNCTSYTNYSNESKAVSGTCEGFEDKAVTSDTLGEAIEITGGKTYEYEVILTFIETGSNQDYNKGKIFNSTLEVKENVLLTANLNSGTLSQTLKTAYEIGETIELPSPYKANYFFTGWSATGRGTSIDGDSLTLGDANATITANYIALADMYTYTGNSTVIDDGYGNWRIKFLTNGTFTPLINMTIDAFLVGGGGSGRTWEDGSPGGSGGGGGGYTKTVYALQLQQNVSYNFVVGLGGNGGNGGATTAFNNSASGGIGGGANNDGGSGGSGGGAHAYAGGTDGSNGEDWIGTAIGGIGQRTTTREFGEATGTIYSNGGSGSQNLCPATSGAANTGNGGKGAWWECNTQFGTGGSGIIVIRNHKTITVGNTKKYVISYSGLFSIVDGNTDNWKIKFLTSGTFTPSTNMTIDAFLVGGGGSGKTWDAVSPGGSGGGGGGYTKTLSALNLQQNVSYDFVVGSGGNGDNGGATTAFSNTASGGIGGGADNNGGAGGSGGGAHAYAGGVDGADGEDWPETASGGTGQGTTTKEFGETTGTIYSNGGTGSQESCVAVSGAANTGNGGKGAWWTCSTQFGIGGSGIVVIRNH